MGKFSNYSLLETGTVEWLSSPGVIGTLFLIVFIFLVGLFIFIKRLNNYADILDENARSIGKEELECKKRALYTTFAGKE